MIKKIAGHILLFLLVMCTVPAFSQLTITTQPPYSSPQGLVEGVLLGEGVRASNFTFYGDSSQIGYFKGGKGSVGIETGVALSTGKVTGMAPPQPTAFDVTTSFAGGPNPGPNVGGGDIDLLNVANLVPKMLGKNFDIKNTYDAAILEFDFIPSSDSVVFRYVFASEEYLGYVDTKYNDVFGFFISGPGIDGHYTSPPNFPDSSINIAVVPGTVMPITISSVNDKRNSQYYINNPNNTGITYNGYTTVFTAFAKVQACQTYHIKIAIADGTRDDKDSGVLIEARSFSSGNFTLQQDFGAEANGAALEGCFESRIVVRRESKKAYSDTIYISVDQGSQATQADISPLPPYIVIPAGSDSGVYYFSVLEDGLNEGLENLKLDFHLKTVCADLHRKFEYTIDDAPDAEFVYPNDTSIYISCLETGVLLDARLKDGYGFYNYRWEANGVPVLHKDSTFLVNPKIQTVYRVYAGDTCNTPQLMKMFTVYPPGNVPVKLDMKDTLTAPCKGKDYVIKPEVITGGGQIDSYEWFLDGVLVSKDKDFILQPDSDRYVKLTVRDICGTSSTDSAYIKVVIANPVQLMVSNDTTLCNRDAVTLRAYGSGGSGTLNYYWPDVQQNTQNITVKPDYTTQYTVIVSDVCKSEKRKTIYVKVNEVHADFEYSYFDDFGVEIQNYSQGSELRYEWVLDREAVSEVKDPVFELSDLKNHILELKAFDSNGCQDTVFKELLPPMFVYIPNTFTPNDDGINDVYNVQVIDPVEFEMTIVDRWGQEIYRTTDPKAGWNGISPNTGRVIFGTYQVIVKASRKNNIRIDKVGTVTLLP